MADIQPGNGGTIIANELIRKVLIKGLLTKAQMQIVFAIIDESWGWVDRRRSTKEAKVKYKTTRKPIKHKEFAENTGIHISDVGKTINGLLEAKVIRRHWDYYRFNKNYDHWLLDVAKETRRGQKNRIAPDTTQEQPAREKRKQEEHGNSYVAMLGDYPSESQVTREFPYQTRENTQHEVNEKSGKTDESLGKSPSDNKNTRENTQSTRENTQSTRENTYETPSEDDGISGKASESALGKNPNATREIPYSWWGKTLMRWPAMLRAARDSEPLNKKEINLNKLWSLYEDVYPDYWTKAPECRYTVDELEQVFDYFQMLKHTRSSGKLAAGVIEKEMDYWERFDKDLVLASLWLHREKYKTGKKEDYTRGIVRRAQDERKRGIMPNVLTEHQQATGLHKPGGSTQGQHVYQMAGGSKGPGQGASGKRIVTNDEFEGLGIGH